MLELRFAAAALALAALAVSCGGGTRDVPASPVSPTGGGASNITAPTVDTPADDAQLDTLRPTLTVNNASSSGSGSRSYEFQISDNNAFTVVAGRMASFVVAVTQAGIAEGPGRTSFTPQQDLLPATRYYWRARANVGAEQGPWSATGRFRTRIDSFKSGNQVFDILTNGQTVADQRRNVAFALSSDPNPGAKLEGPDSFLRYSLTSLPEGEVSFIARRVKPGDSSFNGQTKVLSIQEGTSDFNSNPFRVRVEKRPPSEGGKMVFQFASQGNAGNAVETGGLTWVDLRPYYFKLEWRAGTARLRVFSGENETAPQLVDLSTTYTTPYAAGTPNVIIGSLLNDSLRDIRVSRLYIGPFPRPVSLGSALTP